VCCGASTIRPRSRQLLQRCTIDAPWGNRSQCPRLVHTVLCITQRIVTCLIAVYSTWRGDFAGFMARWIGRQYAAFQNKSASPRRRRNDGASAPVASPFRPLLVAAYATTMTSGFDFLAWGFLLVFCSNYNLLLFMTCFCIVMVFHYLYRPRAAVSALFSLVVLFITYCVVKSHFIQLFEQIKKKTKKETLKCNVLS